MYYTLEAQQQISGQELKIILVQREREFIVYIYASGTIV